MSTPRAKPKYYLTTPLYYTNGMPHIGHTYSTIVADVIRRYKRMRGFDVFMTTGADEHGVNVERSAQKAGKSPQEFSTEIAVQWRQLWDDLGIPGDEFIRTTDEKHHRTVQWLFKRCRDNGFIEKGRYTGQYCVHDNAYVVDAGPGDACPDCGRPTETVTEENYFFKLSGFQQKLLDFYAANPDFIQPESRRNEVLSFVNGGLKNLSITRTTIRWGIPVPGEAPHVFYVWFDALIGYLSAVGGPNYDQRGLWPADLHIVGKEIIRFHAVYWPAFLMAADLPLPEQIWAHGWLLFDSEKMSKSRGNVVRPRPIVNAIGIEPLRYYLLREIVFGQDGSFSYDALVTRYNSDLANGLGNLASRTLTMIERYFGGEIPKPAPARGRGNRRPQHGGICQRSADEGHAFVRPVQFFAGAGIDLGDRRHDRQIHHGRKTVGARGKAGGSSAPGDGAVHGCGRAAYRHGAGASRAAASDAKNMESVGADGTAERRPVGPALLGTAQARNENGEAGRNFPAR